MTARFKRLSVFVAAQALALTSIGGPAPGTVPAAKDVESVAPATMALREEVRGPSTPDVRPPSSSTTRMDGAIASLQPRSLAGRLLFDEPGDGTVWVLGGTSYKARFDGIGATYYPFFGSDTPRHSPLGLTLHEVRIGGQPVEIDRAATCERDGDLLIYEHGALVEFYEMSPTTMEQKFLFDQLPATGDLLVRVAVETELSCVVTPDGFRFEGEHGSVGYSRAVVVDASGAVGAASTTFADGVVEIRVPSEFLLEAAWPVTIDPVVATFPIDLDPTVDAFVPDVAYDETTDRYNVVWEQVFTSTDHDVYSQLWTSGGTLVAGSEVSIDQSTVCWKNPQVANNQVADQFLTVCERADDCIGFPTNVLARTRQAASNLTGPVFDVDGLFPGQNLNPDVGGDPASSGTTYYCVVWQNENLPTSRIFYNLVRTDSTTLWDLPRLIDDSFVGLETNPSISKSNGQGPSTTQEWNVVWQRQIATGDEDVRGAQIHRDGSITTPSFAIDSSNANDRNPQVSSLLNGGTSPRAYLVAWQRGSGSAHDIYGKVLVGSAALTASVNLTSLEGGTHQGQDQIRPATDTDGTCFAVVYSEQSGTAGNYDVYVSTFAEAGGTILATESHENLASSVDSEERPELTSVQSATDGAPSSPQRFMAVWQDGSSPSRDIEGGLYDSVCPGDAAGTPLCFGDGSGPPCPCNNDDGPEAGCRNTTGRGCRLTGIGSSSISAGDLVLGAASALPFQPGLFFQGDDSLNGGAGIAFGDGLRCCGENVVRLEIRVPDAGGRASTTVGIAATGGVSVGETRCYQFWYRDPPGLCGSGFNLSNAYQVTWAP